MLEYKLGTIEASEALIKDLYIDLRTKVNAWSEITQQTPQARMGYIGQHLVSVVTGYPGGKSGARGDDLIMGTDKVGEIKSCCRVDQLGKCSDCNSPISSYETICSSCGSDKIERKEDSKWLIPVKDNSALSKVLSPERYYFVLFEYANMSDIVNSDTVISIWEVDPRTKGFTYCMMDYHVNSNKNAPFNMWPYSIKFELTNPTLIYRSRITATGELTTQIFPSENNALVEELKALPLYEGSKTFKVEHIKNLIKKLIPTARISRLNKRELLGLLENYRTTNGISNLDLCNMLADEIYLPLIVPKKEQIPSALRNAFPDLCD